MKILEKVFGTREARAFRKCRPQVDAINEEFDRLSSLSDEELRARTEEFRQRLADGETVDDLLVEAFASVKEVCRRLMNRWASPARTDPR